MVSPFQFTKAARLCSFATQTMYVLVDFGFPETRPVALLTFLLVCL